jgi:hypothetical protein
VDATSTGDRWGIALQNPLNGDGKESNYCSLSRFGTGPGPLRSPMYIALSALSLNDGQCGRLPENRDVVGIAAERGDVALHALQSGDLIEQAVIARSVLRRFPPSAPGAPESRRSRRGS